MCQKKVLFLPVESVSGSGATTRLPGMGGTRQVRRLTKGSPVGDLGGFGPKKVVPFDQDRSLPGDRDVPPHHPGEGKRVVCPPTEGARLLEEAGLCVARQRVGATRTESAESRERR